MVMRHQGKSCAEIAATVNVSRSTVERQTACDAPPSRRPAKRHPPSKHKRAIASRRRLVKELAVQREVKLGAERKRGGKRIVRHRLLYGSCSQIRRALAQRGITRSKETVRRDLHAMKMTSRKRPTGPRRYNDDHDTRVAFAQRDDHPTDIIFSDEKMFDVNDHCHDRQWVRPGEQPLHRERDGFAAKVHVWGMIGRGGRRRLVFLPPGGITADVYIRECLAPSLATIRRGTFMHDGAKAHTAKRTREWLAAKHVRVLRNWPPRSPDLNPIETMWAIVQREVDAHGPTDADELRAFVQQAFYAIPQATVDALVDSFEERLAELRRIGGRTLLRRRGGSSRARRTQILAKKSRAKPRKLRRA